MSRSRKIAIVLLATMIWFALSRALYHFAVVDRCLDAGGAVDAASQVCIGAPWSAEPSIVTSLAWPAWLLVIGLPGMLLVALVLVAFRILGKAANHAA